MRGKEIITKLIIPGAIAMIICLIVHPMCMNGEILDWRKLLLFVGIPFGIQKMFLLVVPRNVGTGEMLGLLVLKLMVGSWIGIGVLGGIIAWFAYITGIKGKEKDQKASERKNEIYIPLKYELKSLIRAPSDIWKELKVTEIEKIVEKNDELVVSDYLWKQCEMLLQLINSYNSIDLYNVVGKILCTQFEKKYIELYGSLTHPMTHWDEISGEEFEYEECDQEFMDFTKRRSE